MMKKFGFAVVLALTCVLCFALAGCGNGGGADKAAYVGSWNLYSLESSSDDSNLTSEDIATMSSLGLQVSIQLNEDGTLVFTLFDEVENGTWEGSTVKVTGEEMGLSLDGDKLVLEQDGEKLIFAKAAVVNDAAAPAADAAAPAADVAAAA